MPSYDLLVKDAGGFLLGLTITAFLLGIITIQAAEYYTKFPDDKVGLKILVGVIVFAQYFNIVCAVPAQYRLSVLLDFDVSSWYGNVYTLTAAVSSLFTQFFFAFRIGKMKKRWASFVIAVVSVVQLGLGLVIYIQGVVHPQANKFALIVVWSWCVLLLFDNVLIAVVMTILLRRNITGFPRTDRAVKLLMRYVVHSGIATGIVSFLVLLTRPSHDGIPIIVVCFTPMLGAVSTMTVLANLLVRLRVRRCFDGKTEDGGAISIHISRLPTQIRQDVLAAIPDDEPSLASTFTLEGTDSRRSSARPSSSIHLESEPNVPSV